MAWWQIFNWGTHHPKHIPQTSHQFNLNLHGNGGLGAVGGGLTTRICSKRWGAVVVGHAEILLNPTGNCCHIQETKYWQVIERYIQHRWSRRVPNIIPSSKPGTHPKLFTRQKSRGKRFATLLHTNKEFKVLEWHMQTLYMNDVQILFQWDFQVNSFFNNISKNVILRSSMLHSKRVSNQPSLVEEVQSTLLRSVRRFRKSASHQAHERKPDLSTCSKSKLTFYRMSSKT